MFNWNFNKGNSIDRRLTRPLIGPFIRYRGEVGFEISEMPSGERGTERWPPISGDWEAVKAESISEVFVRC